MTQHAETDMANQDAPPLSVWAVSDGRIGIENQCLGLAEAIARQARADISVRRIRYKPAFDRLPSALKLFPDLMLTYGSDRIEAPWPDIFIAAGRATIPHASRMRAWSQGKTLVVQLQNPRWDLSAFDVVIAPDHDQVVGDNVLSILGSTHRITPERCALNYPRFAAQIDDLPSPRIAVMVGGASKTHDIDKDRAQEMVAQIGRAVRQSKGSLLLTLSRRTPPEIKRLFVDGLKSISGFIYDGQGDNPYFAFLHAADQFLVTEDSVNMVTEACAMGKPVHILAMNRKSLKSGLKFDRFHQSLQERGLVRAFMGELTTWPNSPLNETQKAADFVLNRFKEKFPKRDLLRP